MQSTERVALLSEGPGSKLFDISDSVVELSFESGGGIIDDRAAEWAADALEEVEPKVRGIIVTGHETGLCAGVDAESIRTKATEGSWKAMEEVAGRYQKLTGTIAEYAKPVVVVAQGKTLDFGTELALCSPHVCATDELSMGLRPTKNGFLPMGGGIARLAYRLHHMGDLVRGLDVVPLLRKFFDLTLLGVRTESLREAKEAWLFGREVQQFPAASIREGAKHMALALPHAAEPDVEQEELEVTVTGATGKAALEVGVMNAEYGGFITAEQRSLASLLAWVLSGGDLPRRATISEERFLELERIAFVEGLKHRVEVAS